MSAVFEIGMERVKGRQGVGKFFYLAGLGMVRRPLYLNLNKNGWSVTIPGQRRESFNAKQYGTVAAAFIAAREYLLEEMGVLFYARKLKSKEAYSKEVKIGVPGVTFNTWYDEQRKITRRRFEVKHPLLDQSYVWYIPIDLSRDEFAQAFEEAKEAAIEKRKYLEEIYYQPPRIAYVPAEFEDQPV